MRKVILLFLLLTACASEPMTEETPTQVPQESTTPATFIAPGDHTPDEIYEKLKPLAFEVQREQPRDKKHTQFSFGIPSDKPKGDQSKEWIQTSVTVYHKDQKTVNQITLETTNCNVKLEDLDRKALQKRLQSLVALVSRTLFGTPFELSDKAFVDISPEWDQPARVPIKQEYLPVVDMRMIRNVYKCDTRDGYGYRYDFFMK